MRAHHSSFIIRHSSFLLALLLAPTHSPAQSPTTRPATDAPLAPPGSRILKTFDFEEKKLGNFEPIPMFWSKVQGLGFPAYSSGKFDFTTSRPNPLTHEPGASFQLQIDGGSAAFRYSPGKLPINPNADYYILAYVKTTPLLHARAQLSAFFADDKDHLLTPDQLHFDSEPYASTRENAADWHLVHIYIPGAPDSSNAGAAKSLVLQMGLLQPQQLAPTSDSSENSAPTTIPDLGPFALYQQDLKGAAWFDDITVIQLPRLSVSVPANIPANIFPPNHNIELDLTVSDLAPTRPLANTTIAANVPAATSAPVTPNPSPAGRLAVTLNITNPDDLLFASEKFSIPTASSDTAPPWTHHFTHAPLPPGLYLATLEVAEASTGNLIARRKTRFLSLAPPFAPLATPASDFGFTLPASLTPDQYPLLPHILRDTQAGLLQLPAWRADMSEEALLRRDPPLDSLLASLQKLNVHALANFPLLPNLLAEKIQNAPATQPPPTLDGKTPDALPPDSILNLAQANPELWRPYLSFLLARYANRIDFWEFGSLADPYSNALIPKTPGLSPTTSKPTDPRYPQLFAQASTEMNALIEGHRLLVPWNALFDFDPKRYPNARLDLRLPNSIKPSHIPAYIDNFNTPGTSSTLLAHLEPLDPKQSPRSARLADFAKRIVYARSAQPAAILIDLPLTSPPTLGSLSTRPEPDETLLVYRALIQATGNCSEVRELPLAPNVKTFLFARKDTPGGDTLVLWSTSPTSTLDLPLGPTPQSADLLGATRPLPVSTETQLAKVPLTTFPLILFHIDSRPVQLRASFALSAPNFPAGAGAVRTEILLTNPYPDTLSGTLRLIPPPNWSIDPPSLPISLAPGKSLRQPVIIRYPFSQFAGPTAIAAHFTPDNNPAAALDFSTPVQVLSDRVQLEASSQFLPNGDLVIQQVITNISSTPLNAQAYVLVPGYPRQERYILDLAPNQSIIKRFTLPLTSWTNATKETTPATLAAALTHQSAAVGLHDPSGQTLITKPLPLQ